VNDFVAQVGAAPEEFAALEAAVGADTRINAARSNESKGTAEVLLAFPAVDFADAVAQTREVYAELRRASHLDPADPLYAYVGIAEVMASTAGP
jgi:hypothetical protein